MPRVPPALALGSACVLVLAAYAGPAVLALSLLFGQLVLAGLWLDVTRPDDPRGTFVVAAVAALCADVAVLLAGTDPPSLRPLAPVLGLLVPVALVQQLARRDGRAEVVSSMTGTLAIAALAVLPSALVAARATRGGVVLVACVLVGATLVAAVPPAPQGPSDTPRKGRGPRDLAHRLALGAAVAVAGAVGGWVGTRSDVVGTVRGALLAVASGVVAVCVVVAVGYTLDGPSGSGRRGGARGRRRARRAPPREQQAFGVVLPLVVACPAAYLLGRLVVS